VHLEKALVLLATLPDNRQRAEREIALQNTLTTTPNTAVNFADRRVEQAYLRARERGLYLGDPHQLFATLRNSYHFYVVRAELTSAQAIAEQCLDLARQIQDATLFMEAHRAMGDTLHFRGQLNAARDHIRKSNALYDANRHRSHTSVYGFDTGAVTFSGLGSVLWLFSAVARRGAPAGSKILGTAYRHQSGAAVAGAGKINTGA
jgi:hypothetical protein